MYELCRYLDLVTLTYILHSIDFYNFYVALSYVLNYKAFNHQTLYSASSWCTDSASTLTRWPWPIFCTPVTLTYFTLMFYISSNIRPTTTKPSIVLHLIVLPGGHRFNPRRSREHSFVEIDDEIFSTVILSLPLILEGHLSVSGERMCTILVNRLED